MSWTREIINKINQSTTIQNQPFDENKTPLQDIPLWVVTINNHIYLRAGKGKESKWYQAGIKNGGQIKVDGQIFKINYRPVTDKAEEQNVTKAYLEKYHGQYPIDMMISPTCANATVELIQR
ncbi:DUF2255 family protein [Lactobacillus sp. PV037]|uniref:DUF2255 family protein n=1 Tax=Lactobacillus sp. PV037 TaxID=2594496 RepID=UPI002240AB64|nr:DUF2255 family protein [Lactobacillus sp. PV037]QNQ83676.1 DUF2255 family protein [Lactobacillus sp. PV037]